MLEAADRVRRVVPFEAAALTLLDPDTFLPVRLEVLGPNHPELTALLLRNEILSPNVHKLGELAYLRNTEPRQVQPRALATGVGAHGRSAEDAPRAVVAACRGSSRPVGA